MDKPMVDFVMDRMKDMVNLLRQRDEQIEELRRRLDKIHTMSE
jgi:hypothetical protein